ncbi:hypothetical protein L0P88_01400 [Muricauda sp. SCSIO 64092]|uniref:hypothetical protein n=1 Tax=Allomuricauda sp. SCSIO 64092 TaxID=2908842 RepID=UPI001FF617D2|nr:hypothetical protein [Muricauda sp. SCSIO 64092]UOY07221.1 hypothetical protein L0P88_01400 [Muricauda sp. SCSIO 64092]
MSYKREEAIQGLVRAIRFNSAKIQPYQDEVIRDSQVWNAPLFFAEVLWNSNRPIKGIDRKSFDVLVKKYNSKYESANVNDIFNRFWLREILGFIHIPSAVRSVLFDYEKHKMHYKELQFLNEVSGDSQDWTTDKFEYEAKKFATENEIEVDTEWLLGSGFIKKSEVENSFKIRFSEYYSTLIEYWKDFQFLNYLKLQLQGLLNKSISIEIKKFSSILDNHKSVYPSTPKLDYFLDNQYIKSIGDAYVIQNPHNNDLLKIGDEDQMATLLWRKLRNEKPDGNPRNIVLEFLGMLNTISDDFVFGEKLTQHEQRLFMDGALELIFLEPDIKGREEEFKKCRLDSSFRGSNLIYEHNFRENEKLEYAKDVVDLFERMDHMEKQVQNNIFFGQYCRSNIYSLLGSIIKMDVPFARIEEGGTQRTIHFPAIKKLLKESLERPFLVWSIYNYLKWIRPEVIPYLLIEPDYDTLGFFLLTSYKNEHVYKDISYEIRTKTLIDALKLSLSNRLQSNEITHKENAKFLFNVFNWLNKDKYRKNVASPDPVKAIEMMAQIDKRESDLLKTVEKFPEKEYNVHAYIPTHFLPKVLPDLVNHIINYEEKQFFARGTLAFPLFKFDMLSWLFKYVLNNGHLQEISKQPQLEKSLSESFVQLFLDAIETGSKKKIDFDGKKKKSIIPSWTASSQRIEKIEWWPIFVLAYRTGSLKELLVPQFQFIKTEDKFEEQNRFNAKKLRTHLTVLMLVLDEINDNLNGLILCSSEIEELRTTIEYQLIDYVERFGVASNRFKVNIFDKFYDRTFNSFNDQLLPKIAELGNSFENRNRLRLWEALSSSQNLCQLLILVENIKASGFKAFLLRKIKEIDVEAFLKRNNWLEVQNAYYGLSKYNELTKEAEIASEYWKNSGPTKSLGQDFEKRVFESHLINAYTKRDEVAIDDVEEPKNVINILSELKPFEQKQFYKALVRFENDPKTAYRSFDDLLKVKPKYISVALNRFAAKISWAQNENNVTLFREALQEWRDYADSKLEEELDFIKDKVAYNILTIQLHLKNHFTFEKIYTGLDRITQLNPDFVELKVTSLLERKIEEQAKMLVQRSIEFNEYKNYENELLKNLYQKLENSTNNQQTVKELIAQIIPKHSLNVLRELAKEDFMAPERFGKNLSFQIAVSLQKLLKKLPTIDNLGHENQYNDLLEMILEERLQNFSLTVKDQSLGGYSESGKGMGSRDITVLEGTRELAVIEPFKNTSKSVIQSHISKLFNYTPNRGFLVVVLYDFEDAYTLEERWKKYHEKILKSLKYPKGFDLVDNSIEDISEELGFKNNPIKIAVSLHGVDAQLFHIMVNICYKAI